jgi:hypothetical protein
VVGGLWWSSVSVVIIIIIVRGVGGVFMEACVLVIDFLTFLGAVLGVIVCMLGDLKGRVGEVSNWRVSVFKVTAGGAVVVIVGSDFFVDEVEACKVGLEFSLCS